MQYKFTVIDKTMPAMLSQFLYVSEYKIEGDYIPSDLPKTGLYDISMVDEVRNVLYLLEWTHVSKPEFRVWKIDGNQKKHWISKSILGGCNSMVLDDGELVLSVYRLLSGEGNNRKYGNVTVRPEF